MTRIRFTIFSAAAFAALILFTSCTAEKDPARTQDRVAIEQLMWDYIQALDAGDAEAYVALFAPEGEFKGVNMSAKGKDALKEMILGYKKTLVSIKENSDKKGHLYHILTNTHIEFVDEDHARYHAYWMGAYSSKGVTSVGREINDLIKIDGRWLIKTRDVNIQE